jgi:anti-sigma regulatory factor (Ser/Thr protein kinase)
MEPAKTHTLVADASCDETTSVSCRTFPADRTAPRAVSAWLHSLSTGLCPSHLADAELCMDELVTNVVRHAWTNEDTGPRSLTLRIDRTDSEVEITVEDAGIAFDPTAAPVAPIARTLDETLPGGRGLMLVRAIATRIAYQRSNGVNRTTIAFPVETA